MLEILICSIIVYIVLGLIFWGWVQSNSLSARAKWKNEYTWDSKAVLIAVWLPTFIVGTYKEIKDWMKS